MMEIRQIPSAKGGGCFHGEVWMCCPYCNEAIEVQSTKEEYTEDGYRVYKCKRCNNYFKDK